MRLNDKLNKLENILIDMKSVGIAFSGGVDSTLLLNVAHKVLGDRVTAFTANSDLFPAQELKESIKIAENIGVKHKVVYLNILKFDKVRNNGTDRCYFCKKIIFSNIIEAAKKSGIDYVVDGSNIDDDDDYRPGSVAIKELGVMSPLKNAGLNKEDIRELSKSMGLTVWDKPAKACLASRFPYGEKLTASKLDMVQKGESFLEELGFKQLRLRSHGDIARIEVEKNEREKFFNQALMDMVDKQLKDIGFKYVSLDLGGYKTGNLNKGLKTFGTSHI